MNLHFFLQRKGKLFSHRPHRCSIFQYAYTISNYIFYITFHYVFLQRKGDSAISQHQSFIMYTRCVLRYITEEAELFQVLNRHAKGITMFQDVYTMCTYIFYKGRGIVSFNQPSSKQRFPCFSMYTHYLLTYLQRKGICFLQSAVIQTDVACFSIHTQCVLTYFTKEGELFPTICRHPNRGSMFQDVYTVLPVLPTFLCK